MAHAPVPRAIPMPSARPFAQALTPAPSASPAKAMGRATLTAKLPCASASTMRPATGQAPTVRTAPRAGGAPLASPGATPASRLASHACAIRGLLEPTAACSARARATARATASAMTGPQAMAVARATRAGVLCTVFCSSQAASLLGVCVAGQHQHWGWTEQLRVCLRGSVCSGHGRGNLNPHSKLNMTACLPPTVQCQKTPENYRALFTRKENGGEQKRHE